jgi:glutathionyl-hydroquinone reductase
MSSASQAAAEPGHHLIAAYSHPGAHQAILMRQLKGLQVTVTTSATVSLLRVCAFYLIDMCVSGLTCDWSACNELTHTTRFQAGLPASDAGRGADVRHAPCERC